MIAQSGLWMIKRPTTMGIVRRGSSTKSSLAFSREPSGKVRDSPRSHLFFRVRPARRDVRYCWHQRRRLRAESETGPSQGCWWLSANNHLRMPCLSALDRFGSTRGAIS